MTVYRGTSQRAKAFWSWADSVSKTVKQWPSWLRDEETQMDSEYTTYEKGYGVMCSYKGQVSFLGVNKYEPLVKDMMVWESKKLARTFKPEGTHYSLVAVTKTAIFKVEEL